MEEGRQLKIAGILNNYFTDLYICNYNNYFIIYEVVHQNDLITDEEPTLRNGGGVFLIFLITIAILGVLTFSGADVVVGKFISSLAFESDTDQLENKSDADFGGRIRKLLNS